MVNSHNKLDMDESLLKVRNECISRNISFIGLNGDEWLGNKTKLLLQCNKCGYEWNSTTYKNFIKRGVGCLNCNKLARISEKKILQMIYMKCREEDYTFNGFVNDKNESIKYSNTQTHFSITCNKCCHSWITTYDKFIRKNHGCLGCTKYARLNLTKALNLIKDSTNEVSLCDNNGNETNEWHGVHETYVRFKCKICGTVTISTFNNFINRKHKCISCYKQSLSSVKLNERKCHIRQKVVSLCENLNYKFNGFCDARDGDTDFIGIHNTYLRLHCNKCGNSWNTCSVSNFFKGRMCPKCKHWKLEGEIKELLVSNNIEFHENIRPTWLEGLELDFLLPKSKIGIECQGLQHFKPIQHWGGDKMFCVRVRNDKKKLKLCKINGIKLLYYSNLGIKYPYNVFEDKEKLLEEIMRHEEIDE